MDWYSVHVEARAPEGEPGLDEETADQAAVSFADALASHYFSGGVGLRSWDATVSVSESSITSAASVAVALTRGAALNALIPAWPLVRAEAVREDVHEEDLERTQLPDLVAAPEAAEILGVSAQRVHVLANENSSFPDPILRLKTGKIWLRAAVVRFAETWERKPGRPKKAAMAAAVRHNLAAAEEVARETLAAHTPGDAYEESIMGSVLSDREKLDAIHEHRAHIRIQARALRIREARQRHGLGEPGSKPPAELPSGSTSKTPAE